ncbi:MAG: PAS domain S-box protein, partial [Cyanobacteria bacterium J06635_10]
MNSHVTADNSGNNLSQGFLLRIINSISDPIFVKDRQHRLIFLNDAYCRFTGYTPEEAIGKSDYDLFSAEEADISWEKDELIFTSGVSSEDEGYFTDAQGKNYIISTSKSLFNNESDNLFLVTTIKNIATAQKEELRKQKLNNLADNVVKAISNLFTLNDFDESINTTLAALRTAVDVEDVSIIAENDGHPTGSHENFFRRKKFSWVPCKFFQEEKTLKGTLDDDFIQSTLINQDFKQSNNDIQQLIDIFPRWYEILSLGEMIVGTVNNFTESERDVLQAQNINSILVIPIKVSGEFWGCISFYTCEKERQWLDNEKSILQAATDCL